jgi:hypothetical protein
MILRRAYLVFCVCAVLGLASSAHAQATRTFVSGVGDDVNPCSRTAPCKTFAGAISKTANGGFINILDPGGFGALNITKSLTVDGDGAHAGVLASLGSNGFIINGAGIKVTLRNLSIESPSVTNPGNIGIRVIQAAEVHIENVVINGFSSHAIDFNPTGGAEGYINNTTAINNGGSAVNVVTGRVMINGLRAESNDTGVMVRGAAIATVTNSHASGGSVGFGANTNAAAVINVTDSVTTHNANGIFAASGATVRVGNSLIVSNTTTGLFNGGGGSTVISMSGNSLTGNFADGIFSGTVAKQ